MKKKVLFIFHDSNPLSGATASMLEVVRSLSRTDKYEINALIPSSSFGLHKELSAAGIQYTERNIYGVRHDCAKGKLFIKKLKSCLAVVLNLIVALKLVFGNQKYDLIYTNTSDNYIGAFLSKFLRTKHIWHIREFGLEDQNMTHCFGERVFYKFLDSSSDKVIAISEALKTKLLDFGISDSKIKMIYNDVASKADTSGKVFNQEGTLSLLIVGSIIEGKGHKFVIDCLAYLKTLNIRVKLGVVGKDTTDYALSLKHYIKEQKVEDQVEFLGYRPDVPKIRNEYDIAVVASKSEAFGRVTVEAMQAKMTVLASDCGANPELISSGENGFLFQYDNIQAFAGIVSRIDKDRSVLEAIGTQAHSSATKFSSGLAALQVDSVISTVLD